MVCSSQDENGTHDEDLDGRRESELSVEVNGAASM
jgi:hypothetical protein